LNRPRIGGKDREQTEGFITAQKDLAVKEEPTEEETDNV